MGCGPAFTIRMNEPLGEPGSYEVLAVSESGEIRCEYQSPLPQPISTRDCGSLRLWFDAAGALTSVVSDRLIGRLALSISRDGVVVAEKTFSPEYSFDELNGPGCGTCASASDSL